MRRLLTWLDDSILTILSSILLVFIPLFPKLPLFEAIPGYIVRVRIEDLLVSGTLVIWLIWLLRGKAYLKNNPLIRPIASYLLVGIISIISAVFIIQTVPFEAIHVGKIILHYLRRVEYFSLFFIFFSTVRSLKQIKLYTMFFLFTVLGVIVYGFGQKYLYWPAFSTMNREFSKGWMLYLSQHARVLSTFGGHYDLAAFIMMVLVLCWSIFFSLKKWIYKSILFLIIAGAFWLLILTASRTSFLAYIGGISAMFFLWSYRKGLRWSAIRCLMVITLSIVVMLSFGDLSERFTKLLRINERFAGIKSILLSPFGVPPSDRALFLENNPNALAQITSKSDQPPSPDRPSDVFQDIPLLIPIATGSATVSAVTRTYSRTAFMYDLSTAIRFDALWPMAIKGFKKNPLVGSGYSTLNKKNFTEFTEAESTDNDYLRSLGETGILGFLTFYGTLMFMFYLVWRNLSIIDDRFFFSLAVGLNGLLIGLFINAVYIDVFEASKVAFSFWALAGVMMGGVSLFRRQHKGSVPLPSIPDLNREINMGKRKIRLFFQSNAFPLIIILSIAFILRLYKINTPLADWHSWRQADTSAVTRNYVHYGINLLFPTYDDLSNVASGRENLRGLRFVEFPLYNFFSVITDKIFVGYNIEVSGRLTSIFSSLGSIVFLYFLVKKYLGKKEAILTSLFFAILPYNIYYSRVILPEPFLVFCSTGMIFFFDSFVSSTHIKRKILFFFFSFVFTVFSLLVKPTSIFLFIPMIYLCVRKYGLKIPQLTGFFLFFITSGIPLLLWRLWIANYPEGIPAYTWLLNGDGIRFKGAFFYWIFADRLARLILGYWGLPLLLFGVLSRVKKEGWLFYLWGISMLLYLVTFATGNVRHDYYQIIIIPILSVFMAKGIVFLQEVITNNFSRWKIYGSIVILVVFTEMFGWYHIRDYYNINHPEIVDAGNAVERKTNSRSLVIAPYNGDTAFLYQTKRAGWPIMTGTIDDLISRGADYFVSVNFDDVTKSLMKEALLEDQLLHKFKIIDLTDKYVIIQLVPDSKLPK